MNVRIKGAGPAGLASGILLLKKGNKVTLYDRLHNLGKFDQTVHGVINYADFVEGDMLEYISKSGLDVGSAVWPIKSIVKYSSLGYSSVTTILNESASYNFLRGKVDGSLDNLLLNEFKRLGGELVLSSDPGEDIDIDASGSKSADFVSYGQTFIIPKEIIDSNSNYILFDYNIIPKGYAYLLPFGMTKITVSVFLPRNEIDKRNIKNDFSKSLIRFSELLKFDPNILTAISEDAGFGGSKIYESYFFKNTFLVGTRAGLITADYGFGLKESIYSAILLSNSFPNKVEYDKLLKRNIVPYLFSSYLKRWKLNRLTNKDIDSRFKLEPNVTKTFKNKKSFILKAFIGRLIYILVYDK